MERAVAAMKAVAVILGMVLVVLLVGGLHRWLRLRQRGVVSAQELREDERALLFREVPLYARLPSELRTRLESAMQVFLHEIGFEPCGGLKEVTREMQLVIASQACLLLLESGYEHFGRLRTVLLYPDAYEVKDEYGVDDVRLGESWETGSVVLSWESVRQGTRNPEDGLNVVLHEFAHQIDQYDGEADGLPLLRSRSDYDDWAEAFQASYEELCAKVERGERTVLDEYGATDPAEFFAVATETFFEEPARLKQAHPDVFAQLERFYGLDPLDWKE